MTKLILQKVAQIFHMWRHFFIKHMPDVENFRFLHVCHVEKLNFFPVVEKFLISPQLPYIKAENSPHGNFFSIDNISDISDKYEV